MPPKRRLNDIASALCSAPSSTAAAERLDEQQAEEIQPERDYFRRVAVAPDVALRVVVEGAGPLVVLLHGFPQGWYLWRHTIKPLCDAGFRVAAPDQRGYGLSDAPGDAEQYGLKRLTRDVVELAKGLGHEEFYVVGHDWGCQVAWHVAALYPQSVLGVLGLDVPYTRDPSRGGVAKQLQEDPSRFWYIKEFMENAERFEAEAEADLRRWLHSVLWALSGDSPYGTWMEQLSSASGSELLDTIPAPPDATLSWLSEADLDYMTDQFELHGLFGPIAWYRNFGDWYEISDALDHPAAGAAAGAGAGVKAEEAQPPQRFEMPSGFLYGSDSDIMRFDPNWEEEMPHYFKDMRMCEEVEDCGHWLPLEQTELVNAKMIQFLRSVEDERR